MSEYKSPIEVIYEDIQYKFEDAVLKAVQDCNIRVNKEELLSALMSDKERYEEAWQRGYEAALPKWIPTKKECPKWGRRVIVMDTFGTVSMGYCRQKGEQVEWRVVNPRHFGRYTETLEPPIAWMPLPKPWKGEEG